MVWTLEHREPEVRKTRDLRFSLDLLFLSGAGPFVSLDLSFLICKMGSMDRVIFQGTVMIVHLLCSFKLLFALLLTLSTPSFSPLPSLSTVSLFFFYPSSSCFPPLPSHLLLFIFSLSALPSTSSSSSFPPPPPPPPRFLSPADPTLFSPGYLLNSTHACTDGINPRLPCLQLISAPND